MVLTNEILQLPLQSIIVKIIHFMLNTFCNQLLVQNTTFPNPEVWVGEESNMCTIETSRVYLEG